MPSIQGSSPTLVQRPVELRNRKDAGGDSARALECLADSPPGLFVYSPLNAEDMDILDVSDEELAPLQAFVDEIKDDSCGDGDLESDVEQVSDISSSFLRSLPSYMKQIQQIRFDKYSSEWLPRRQGKTEAEFQHRSCTGSFQNFENPKEIFAGFRF